MNINLIYVKMSNSKGITKMFDKLMLSEKEAI